MFRLKSPVRSIKDQVQMLRVEYDVYYGQKLTETCDTMRYDSCHLVPSHGVKNTEEQEGCISLSAIWPKFKY
jgi:hypothetical protein